MDGRGSKLCRTPSSLLRLPISSSSAAAIAAAAAGGDNDNDNKKALHPRRPPPNRRSLPLPLPLLILSAAAFLLLLLFHAASPPLAALILLSAAAAARLLRRHPHRPTPPVHWFIGDDFSPPNFPSRASAGHIGVELYANGDFYEGEFHRGRCSGSGVYSFLASKGRYEGDWVDGKYDGYGVESWARGSRYRGQYLSGMRHGFGLYRFYSGDCYAGEWAGGQSHGVGLQTCSDGSCYAGEFSRGVKHGLGCYHFSKVEMPVRSKAAWNAMIVGYAKAGDVDRAGDLFEQMPVEDLVSWTSMISCYSQSRRFRDAVGVFYKMIESDVLPDRVTMAAVIAAGAHLGALGIGIELHRYAMFVGFEPDVCIGSALVDMYAKCRSIERALVVFFKLREKNLFCWNAVIEGLAMHGRSEETVDMFGRMIREGFQPNWVSFLGACTHVGLAEEGRRMFASMADEYSLVPRVEHYGCMVDLLGRGGFLQETLELIEKMPMEANAAVWGVLLAACKIHENLKIGKIAGEKQMVLEPDNLLVNMYGGAKRGGETAEMREEMNWRGVEKKSPGCSWIEMDGVVLEFAATDTAHTAADELTLLQRDATGISNQNNEMRVRLQSMEQEAHLREDLDFDVTPEERGGMQILIM